MGPVNFTYEFTFGQPFTIDLESELTLNLPPTVSQFGNGIGAAVGLDARAGKVVDANGNPIPGAMFAAVPETGTWFLTLAGILLVLLHSLRGLSKTPSAFPK